MPTVIKECNCKNEYQDTTYGKKQRVHNERTKSYACTVCGNEKPKPVK